MYRIIFYELSNQLKENIIRISSWRNNLEECFQIKAPNVAHFKRVEYRSGKLVYFYCLIDAEAKITYRSINYSDANQCHEQAIEDSVRLSCNYHMDSQFVTNFENHYSSSNPIDI